MVSDVYTRWTFQNRWQDYEACCGECRLMINEGDVHCEHDGKVMIEFRFGLTFEPYVCPICGAKLEYVDKLDGGQ